MAKLSAHGTEVARLVTESDDYITHYSFRSDGHILRRIVGKNVHPDRPVGDPSRTHDWGWKLYKKLQEPKRDTAARMTRLAHASAANAEKKGYLKDIQARPHF
jgi:hypothetical protein